MNYRLQKKIEKEQNKTDKDKDKRNNLNKDIIKQAQIFIG